MSFLLTKKFLILAAIPVVIIAAFFILHVLHNRVSVASVVLKPSPASSVIVHSAQTVHATAAPVHGDSIRVPILVYHNITPDWAHDNIIEKRFSVTPDMLEQQFHYLKDNGYTTVGFDAITDYFLNKKELPAKPVILTFDDGWHSQYAYAYPLLKKYGFTATFFVFSNAIDYRHYMSTDELKEMVSGGMTVGAHSRSHSYLGKITDEAKLRKEIVDNKRVMEETIGTRADFFAYPFGQYNDHIIDLVKQAGYTAARGLDFGTKQSADNLYNLKAMLVPNDLQKFIWELKVGK